MRERFAAIYTAALADVLDARGLHDQTLPPSIRALDRGVRIAGAAYTVRGGPASNPDGQAYDRAIRKVLQMLGDVPAEESESDPIRKMTRERLDRPSPVV